MESNATTTNQTSLNPHADPMYPLLPQTAGLGDGQKQAHEGRGPSLCCSYRSMRRGSNSSSSAHTLSPWSKRRTPGGRGVAHLEPAELFCAGGAVSPPCTLRWAEDGPGGRGLCIPGSTTGRSRYSLSWSHKHLISLLKQDRRYFFPY